MEPSRRTGARAWITPVAVACGLSFLALAQGALAEDLGPCHWTKQVWVNDVPPGHYVTEVTPGYFGVALSDTIHVQDVLWCSFDYQWTLHESWNHSVVSVWDYQYLEGTVDTDVDYLEWWGDHSTNQEVQLDKYLLVGAQGWVTSTVSETVEFRTAAGVPLVSGELPFYLEELVEGGDAPSSHNHFFGPMTTHITGTLANFPVVWDWDGTLGPGPATGYWGFCHYPSLALSPSFLGAAKTQELDADLLPDMDPVTNIDPPTNAPDRDGADDGVAFPTLLPHCGSTNVNVVGQNNSGANLYLNAWADWNRDGDWHDTSLCECGASEWIIQGYPVAPGAFAATIPITPCQPVLDPTEPLWARVTLSELDPLPGAPWIYGGQPHPAPGGCFAEGETEDYLVEPELIPECDWEKQVYINDALEGNWDEGPFAVAVSNTVTISESLTCNFGFDWNLLEEWELPYLSVVSYSQGLGDVNSDPGKFEWTGPYAPPGIPITLTKTLHVDEPGFHTLPITETLTFSPDGLLEPEERTIELVELLEGGDAPSSHNHSAPTTMETYAGSGILAQYPVVWDWDGTLGAGSVTGYYGFCHQVSGLAYLGSPPSAELDADVLPDQDLVTNIDPPTNTPDRDLNDDGVTFPGPLPRCVPINVSFTGQKSSGGPVYLNAWADWNRDGDWEDGSLCGCGDDEWAIQDYMISASTFSVSIPITPCHSPDPTEPIWIRATLSESQLQPLGTPWTYGGQPHPAPQGCFDLGETEDYLLSQNVAYVPLATKRY
jgi:hypothetical protein